MRAPTLLIGLLAASVAVASCDSNPASPTVPLAREFVLAPGDAAAIEGASIRIRFDLVTGDSRCPADVMCIWAGDATVRIEVVPDRGARQSYELHTVDKKPVQHGEFTIALVQLQPYPFSTGPIRPGDYRATLSVTR